MMITNLNDHTSDYTEKMQRCQHYMEALEEERRKIQVFQRELPLCLELVSQAIEACKQQISSSATESNFHGESECSEQISSDNGPVLEEFIPIKRDASASSSEAEEEDDDDEHQSEKDNVNENKASKKSDWLRSVQLWNQTPDPTPKEDFPKKVAVMEVKRNGSGGAFQPFKREKSVGTTSTSTAQVQSERFLPVVAAPSTSAETGGSSGGGGGSKKEEKDGGRESRKQRRCWSPELHRRFLHSLQQLGGSHVATPKQIRELMKVDGLTNDEVKSHLQKYRLHTRRPSHSTHNNTNSPLQSPQFVVVGGIWVPPPEYSAMATAATPNGSAGEPSSTGAIYAPIAVAPPPPPPRHNQLIQSNNDRSNSHSEGGGGVHSTSSSDTTTVSPSTY